ncbi:hypothetical protein PAHAL_8G146300 [Panicum hallii]|uniref:Uncharacterized protein n=1 Tax=Panicum hallii TaxID=206008 RepID=A0A2T8I8W4_9POAL|nr:hypothetical protein PAHAL_8G146300 [Panicum hallii]
MWGHQNAVTTRPDAPPSPKSAAIPVQNPASHPFLNPDAPFRRRSPVAPLAVPAFHRRIPSPTPRRPFRRRFLLRRSPSIAARAWLSRGSPRAPRGT